MQGLRAAPVVMVLWITLRFQAAAAKMEGVSHVSLFSFFFIIRTTSQQRRGFVCTEGLRAAPVRDGIVDDVEVLDAHSGAATLIGPAASAAS